MAGLLVHYGLSRERERPAPTHWFTAGVLTPDLWPRHARPRGRRRLDLLAVAESRAPGPAGAALRAGLLAHRDDDALFHGSPAFGRWRRALAPHAARLVRRASLASFLAHVAAELLLDRRLLLGADGLGAALYEELARLDLEALDEELRHGVGPDARGFGALVGSFRARRHLLGYHELEGVAASVEGVLELLGRGDPPPRPALVELLRRGEERLRGDQPAPGAIRAWLAT